MNPEATYCQNTTGVVPLAMTRKASIRMPPMMPATIPAGSRFTRRAGAMMLKPQPPGALNTPKPTCTPAGALLESLGPGSQLLRVLTPCKVLCFEEDSREPETVGRSRDRRARRAGGENPGRRVPAGHGQGEAPGRYRPCRWFGPRHR